MPHPGPALAALLGALAAPANRMQAARRLAAELGGEALLLFAPDPELGVLLPAPGLPQTLPGAAEWQALLAECLDRGEARGKVAVPESGRIPAHAIRAGGGVVVLAGAEASWGALEPLLDAAPLLVELVKLERQVQMAAVQVRSSRAAAARERVLAAAVEQSRLRLQQALQAAEEAREEARARADEAERLAEELRAQGMQLEEAALELELVNSELHDRTLEAEAGRAAADAANRAKSEFLASMSHELRTPINAVLGYGELLEMEIPGPLTAGQRRHLERIRGSSRHLLTLVNDILDLAKVEAGQLDVEHRHQALLHVVDEALALVEGTYAARGIVLDMVRPNPAPDFVGDRDRVRQVLLNLLSNAAKFTEPHGIVTVLAGITTHPDAGAELAGAQRWSFVRVQDTGIGIEPHAQGAVFQPFVQVDAGKTRREGGTGLGLTISRQLARLMGGDLTLVSQAGVGSTFTLWLPADVALQGEPDASIRVRPWLDPGNEGGATTQTAPV